jgi:hypothetical protein
MTREENRQHWLTLLQQQADSGQSQAEFCQQRQIKIATFQYWRKRLRAQDTDNRVLPVHIVSEHASEPEHLILTLPNGATLRFPPSLPAETLQRFAAALLL